MTLKLSNPSGFVESAFITMLEGEFSDTRFYLTVATKYNPSRGVCCKTLRGAKQMFGREYMTGAKWVVLDEKSKISSIK